MDLENPLVPIGAGVAVAAVAVVMMRSHLRLWRQQQLDTSLDDDEREFHQRRYRRRMQTSACLLLIGVLIPVGDNLPILRDSPALWTVFWVMMLLGTTWTIFRAVGDMASTTAHSRASLARVRRKRRQLIEELEQERAKLESDTHRGN